MTKKEAIQQAQKELKSEEDGIIVYRAMDIYFAHKLDEIIRIAKASVHKNEFAETLRHMKENILTP